MYIIQKDPPAHRPQLQVVNRHTCIRLGSMETNCSAQLPSWLYWLTGAFLLFVVLLQLLLLLLM